MIRRTGLISDTHGIVHRDIHKIFHGVSEILHAGDVCGEVIEELGLIAPVHAVAGNCDPGGGTLPDRNVVSLPWGIACIAHGHLFPHDLESRIRGMMQAFKNESPRLILTGHSHQKLERRIQDTLVINPGAACKPRFNTDCGVAILLWDDATDRIWVEFSALSWR